MARLAAQMACFASLLLAGDAADCEATLEQYANCKVHCVDIFPGPDDLQGCESVDDFNCDPACAGQAYPAIIDACGSTMAAGGHATVGEEYRAVASLCKIETSPCAQAFFEFNETCSFTNVECNNGCMEKLNVLFAECEEDHTLDIPGYGDFSFYGALTSAKLVWKSCLESGDYPNMGGPDVSSCEGAYAAGKALCEALPDGTMYEEGSTCMKAVETVLGMCSDDATVWDEEEGQEINIVRKLNELRGMSSDPCYIALSGIESCQLPDEQPVCYRGCDERYESIREDCAEETMEGMPENVGVMMAGLCTPCHQSLQAYEYQDCWESMCTSECNSTLTSIFSVCSESDLYFDHDRGSLTSWLDIAKMARVSMSDGRCGQAGASCNVVKVSDTTMAEITALGLTARRCS